MAVVSLAPERDYSLKRRHPWVFSGAVARVEGNPAPGETVTVQAADGTVMGHGAWSPASQIRIRMWSFDGAQEIDAAFIEGRLAQAIAARGPLLAADASDAFRLVNAEADGLPGLVVDRYGDYLVCQFTTAGAERWREVVLAALQRYWPSEGIYERSDSEMRALRGWNEWPARRG